MGADIRGAGEIRDCGVTVSIKLHGVKHRIMPDRIEAATCALLQPAAKCFCEMPNCNILSALADKLHECGAICKTDDGG